jgi:hypothetical protein
MNMEYRNLSKSFQEAEWKKRETDGGNEPNWDTILEMSQQNSLCNNHILIKTFKKIYLTLLIFKNLYNKDTCLVSRVPIVHRIFTWSSEY